jgi:hypothetical protein
MRRSRLATGCDRREPAERQAPVPAPCVSRVAHH